MGSPADGFERLRAVLTFLDERPVPPRRVRVGDIEVEFLPPSPSGDAHTTPAGDDSEAEPEKAETDREREARELRELEEGMYGAAEGHDWS